MAVLTLDLCDGATADWVASANVTESQDLYFCKEGIASRKFVIAAGFTTGLIAYKNTSTINASAYRGVSFWIKSDIAIAANTLRLDLCSDNAGATAVDSFTISEALEAGEEKFLHYDSGSALETAIESLALVALLDPGEATINLDKIEACNIFYMNEESGNDANNGSDWDHAWLTISSGATAARIAPGDCIHIAKSPDPVSIGNATWTDGSATLTLATAQTINIEMCDGNTGDWIQSANVTETKETTMYKEGSGARKLVIAAGFTTGLIAYKNISTLDVSTKQKISFWIRVDITGGTAANTYRLDLCSDDAGATPVNSFTIPIRLETARWYCLTYSPDAGAGNLGNAIESVALTALLDPGAATVYIDNIIACATSGLNLQSLLGKNTSDDPTWWPIKSINGTTVIFGEHMQIGTSVSLFSDNTGENGNEIVTTYKRETTKIAPATSSVSGGTNAVQDSGTIDAYITFSGGWNTSTNVRDGITLLDGWNCWGYGIYIGASFGAYIRLEHLGMVRSYRGLFYYLNAIFCEAFDVYSISCDEYGLYLSSNNRCKYNKVYSISCASNLRSNGSFSIINNMHIKGCTSTSGGLYYEKGYENYIYNLISGRNNVSDIGMVCGTLYLNNPKLLTSTEVSFKSGCTPQSFVAIQGNDQTNGSHKKLICLNSTAYFTIALDTTIYDTSPSTRVTPGSASYKSQVDVASVAVDSGQTVTCSAKVRESVVGDGTDYNGNRIRLMLKKNVAMGISEDTLIAIATASSEGAFETISGTSPAVTDNGVLEFFVTCDGTTGWINIDTVTVS